MTTNRRSPAQDDDPSVMGGGSSPAPMPTQAEAEAVWRATYVARLMERGGFTAEEAQALCDAGDVDLSENPADAADAELEYWDADD